MSAPYGRNAQSYRGPILLLHELRHAMQHLSSVNIVSQPGVNYWTDPIETDADEFAQAVSGYPRPQDMSRPADQKAPVPRDPNITDTPMRLPDRP